jgi:hypothetical protein
MLLAALGGCGASVRFRRADRRELAELHFLREQAYGRALYLRGARMPDDMGLRRDLIRPYERGANRIEVLTRILHSELDVNSPYGTVNGMTFLGVVQEAASELSKFLRWSESLTTYARDSRLDERGYDSAAARAILDSAREAADASQGWWMEDEHRSSHEWREQVQRLPLPQWVDLPRPDIARE